MSLTQEEINRMTSVLGTDEWYHEDIKKVPEKYIGLGYKWYPIVIKSEIKDFKVNVHPSINVFKGPDWTKVQTLDEKEITKVVIRNILELGHPDFYNGLSYVTTFVDPKEMEEAINYFKTQGLIGFMSSFDGISVTVNGETFQFYPDNCREMDLKCTKDYGIVSSVHLKFLEDHNRIFNQMVQIEITN